MYLESGQKSIFCDGTSTREIDTQAEKKSEKYLSTEIPPGPRK